MDSQPLLAWLCEADVSGLATRYLARGEPAFRTDGVPGEFVVVRRGKVQVRFRTGDAEGDLAVARLVAGEDFMPLTAAILGDVPVFAEAHASTDAELLVLPAERFLALFAASPAFRAALFAGHAARISAFFGRTRDGPHPAIDARLAAWLLARTDGDAVAATHQRIATDLVTAREVVTRRLKTFVRRGWIVQSRGTIRVTGRAGLSRLARGIGTWAEIPKRGRMK